MTRMERSAALVATTLALAGCFAGDQEPVREAIGDLELVAPTGWRPSNLGDQGRLWEPATNPGKESLAVVVGPQFVGTAEHVMAQAIAAQGVLDDARVVRKTTMTTAGGLVGVQVDVTFRANASSRRYQRSHVVLLAGDHTVSVLYTAANADPTGTALHRVVDSIRVGG